MLFVAEMLSSSRFFLVLLLLVLVLVLTLVLVLVLVLTLVLVPTLVVLSSNEAVPLLRRDVLLRAFMSSSMAP
jgi:hypothetical protein